MRAPASCEDSVWKEVSSMRERVYLLTVAIIFLLVAIAQLLSFIVLPRL